MCLCKLHNFCIDMADTTIADNNDTDKLEISMNGGIPLQTVVDEEGKESVLPTGLLHRGHHYDDILRNLQRDEKINSHDYLLQSVINQNLQHACPRQRDTQ